MQKSTIYLLLLYHTRFSKLKIYSSRPANQSSHWSFEAGERREGIVSTHPSAPSATHSLTQRTAPPLNLSFWPRLGSSLGGCSQAVVGKSRTTGSIYLTSVSSTIAKHHQRAAAPLRTNVSKRSSEEFKFKKKN